MRKVIVTLRNDRNSFSYDLELPTDLEFDNLMDDIVQTVIAYNPEVLFKTAETKLIIPKLGMREMQSGETLEDLGVLNGDYLMIK